MKLLQLCFLITTACFSQNIRISVSPLHFITNNSFNTWNTPYQISTEYLLGLNNHELSLMFKYGFSTSKESPINIKDGNSTWHYFKFSPTYRFSLTDNINFHFGPGVSYSKITTFSREANWDNPTGIGLSLIEHTENKWMYGAIVSSSTQFLEYDGFSFFISLDFDINFYFEERTQMFPSNPSYSFDGEKESILQWNNYLSFSLGVEF